MAEYRTWIIMLDLLVFFLILIASVICFVVPSYLITNNTSSATTTTNNNTARMAFYIAGAVGILIFFFLIIIWWLSYSQQPLAMLTDIESLTASNYGWGTFLLVILIFFLIIFQLFLIIYGLSLIDTTSGNATTNTSNQTARSWAIAAGAFSAIGLILILINFILYWLSYREFSARIATIEVATTEGNVAVLGGSPESDIYTLNLEDVFTVHRNPLKPGKFKGAISIEGQLTQDEKITTYGGKQVRNRGGGESDVISGYYEIEDPSMKEVVKVKPVGASVKKVQIGTVPVQSAEVVNTTRPTTTRIVGAPLVATQVTGK